MLTLKLIKEETERVIKGLKKKHFDEAEDAIAKVLDIDSNRRETQGKLDNLLSESKKYANQIGANFVIFEKDGQMMKKDLKKYTLNSLIRLEIHIHSSKCMLIQII